MVSVLLSCIQLIVRTCGSRAFAASIVTTSMKRPASSLAALNSAERPVSNSRKLSTSTSGGASGSAAQPASSLAASHTAEQPVSKRNKLSINPSGGASGSAEQPATLLEQVEQLGHYPKRYKNPATDKERAENSLAKKISMQWTQLDDATRVELTRLQQPASAERPATLVDKVKQLGHYPKRFQKPATDKERAENSLAEKISKQWSSLDDATKAELARLQKETKGKDVEARAEI